MSTIAFGIASLLIFTRLNAEVYRWIDANGNLHFSDRQPREALPANVLDRDAIPTEPKIDLTPKPDDAQYPGPYSAFAIVLPSANEVLIQETGEISIAFILDPPLVEGHQIDVELDETIIPLIKPATQFKLTGAAFGSHRLQVRIRNTEGFTVAQTPLQIFHLRKPEQPGQLP
ncbi:DUF4124 domain-containing protein [uncultured Thiocystis sp.]|uniref:DUF4124 domain-containing protein n=1 Tax=uncultured Thiocystis sp. TaxID=1202134 RepID=UPI0025EA7F2B|nr:DUF4124 domain-containing protein [uncultured Thiocystis sp.]